jgi:hypothetical protein
VDKRTGGVLLVQWATYVKIEYVLNVKFLR